MTVLATAGLGAAHDPSAPRDVHPYVGAWGDVLIGCRYDADHGGPLDDLMGWGGTCFDFGTDVHGGTSFRFWIDDEHGHPVGGIWRIVSSSNSILVANTPYCGRYPADGGFAHLPSGAFRMWLFIQEAGSVTSCLGHGEVGAPATRGTATVETAG